MRRSDAKALYAWYYSPGEKIRSIGFYMNPYKRWHEAKFRHVFAFDQINLYIGQYSVYQHHIDELFGKRVRENRVSDKKVYRFQDKIEHGQLLLDTKPIVKFDFIESKNIIYLNRRLKIMAQRLYDYGMPLETRFLAPEIGNPTISNILKGSPLERPEEEMLLKLI